MELKSRKFIFKDDASDNILDISIPEVLDPKYGMYVWPSAPFLAQFVWFCRSFITGKSILELGAGTALPGVVAAKCGAKVILSDANHLPECQQNCKTSLAANNLEGVQVIGLTWGQAGTEVLQLPPIDVILASDCFYDTDDFEDVIFTVSLILKRNPKAQFWTTHQERDDHSLEALLEKWNLKSTQVPVKSFEGDGSSVAGSNLPGSHNITLWIIVSKNS